MAYDERLAGRLRTLLRKKRGLSEKKMFGGLGFLLKDHLCVGIWKQDLILRIGDDAYEMALQQPGVSEFDITGRATRGWVLVSAQVLQEDAALSEWVNLAVRFVSQLPPKPRS